MLYLTLMAERVRGDAATSAGELHLLVAAGALLEMALGLAEMSAGQRLLAGLVAVRNVVFAGRTRFR